jgi:two-component system sensor histidine kinase PilS (NtrC family)
MVRQNAQRLSQIVEEILDIARVQHQAVNLSRRPSRWTTPCEATASDWMAQTRSASRRATGAARRRRRGRLRGDHLRRVLVNLLDNALRYASQRDDAIQVATDTREGPVLVVWSDGPPLEAAVERHLFEPFFSSESRSSGLGLYICRELCERHGARITYRRGPRRVVTAATATRFPWLSARPRPVAATVAFARMAA